VTSIIVNKALRLDVEVAGMLFWEKDVPFSKSFGNWRYLDGKHSGSRKIGSFQTSFY